MTVRPAIAAILALSSAISVFAGFPTHGFQYALGVDSQTFYFGDVVHIYNNPYGDRDPMNGQDICMAAEASFARYANAKGGRSYGANHHESYREIGRSASASVFNHIIDSMNTGMYLYTVSTTGPFVYCWLKGSTPDGVVNPSTVGTTASEFLRNCGVQFYKSYAQMAGGGMTAEDNMVTNGEAIAGTKVRRVFNALYNMRKCIVEPNGWNTMSYSFVTNVDGIATPAGYPIGKIAYRRHSRIGVINLYDSGVNFNSRYMVTQSTAGDSDDFCTFDQIASRYAAEHLYWRNAYRVTRKKRDWDTGALTTTIGYLIRPIGRFDLNEILSALDIQNDVSCPELSDELKYKIWQSASPKSSSNAWDDELLVECVTAFGVSQMIQDDYYYNPLWKWQNR